MIAGRYSLEREIGRGGMGAVWLGQDEVLHRQVALKRVGATPDGPAPDLARAEREARLAASLNHPHVVAVYDLVHAEDQRWLVMEYVEGDNLAALVRREGPLSPDRAADLLRQAAEALAAAHSAGVIHRDVKPSNILVTAADQVKLTDFGIARAAADATSTQTGLVTGSPAYLAPEVATGKPASDRSDVWALGATTFHALAGRPPYDVGDNVMGALYRIVHEDPPRLDSAGWLAPLLEATMTTDPADRWSMEQVARFLAGGPSLAAPGSVAADPEPTRAMGTVGAVTPPPVDSEPAAAHPAPQTAPATPSPGSGPAPDGPRRPAAARRRSRRVSPLLIALAAATAVVLLLAVYLNTRPDDTPDPPTAGGPSGSASASQEDPSSSESSETSGDPEETPTPDRQARAEAMEGFARGYLDTVTSDPEATWERLTPAFQRASGGFSRYADYWGGISQAEVLSIGADPDAGSVTYSVEYTRADGSTITDVVTLELRTDGDTFLIAGES